MAGAAVGLVFDFYRSLRRWQGWGKILTFIGDVFFSLVALGILFHFFERANALTLRLYIIGGSLLGLILYLRLLSCFAVRSFFGLYHFMAYLSDLIHRGIKIPIWGLVFIMRPPYAVLHWFSLLFYRIGEYVFFEPILRIKRGWKVWWSSLFPPKTKG